MLTSGDVLYLAVTHANQRRCAPGVRGAALQAVPGVPQRLPLQGAAGQVRHALLPPQCGRAGLHLPGHPEGQMVGAVRRQVHPAVHTVAAGR